MKKFFMGAAGIATLAVMIAFGGGSDPLDAATVTNSVTQIESPCKEAGHTGEQGCAVVTVLYSGQNPMENTNLTTASSKLLAGKAQRMSVIYKLQVKRNAPNDQIGATVNHGGDSIIADVYSNKPVLFWVSSRDGGRSWSKMQTSGTGTISY